MDRQVIRLLLIEDSPDDALIIREYLSDARQATFQVEHFDRLSTALERLAQGNVDAVLLDLQLPDSRGLDTFRAVQKADPTVPVVVLSGFEDETTALTAVHEGAQDYLVKGHVGTAVLERAVRYSIERSRTARALADRNAELARARDEAEAASRAKSAFLASMSHEIRTPMNAIIGMTDFVLETALSPLQREYLRIVQESAESLLSLINDILDFSKIEAGKLELEEVEFSLRDSFGCTLKSLAVQAHRKGLELISDIHVSVPDRVLGDPTRLRQVLVNLVGNAIKFTSGGEVVVRVRPESQTGDEVLLHVAVTDTGIGIPATRQEKLFQAFEQVDSSMSRKYGGTGLGLAISARLVELIGGRIWFDSESGRGSTFHFTAKVRNAADQAPVFPLEIAGLAGARVLVVEDNATYRETLVEMLGSWEMQVTALSSATAALDFLRCAEPSSPPFAVALIDADMPQVDGFELARQIKDRFQKEVQRQVMLLTSGDRSGDVNRCEQMGIDAYLMKPINQSELFDTLSAILHGNVADGTDRADPVPAGEGELSALRVLLAEDSLYNQKLAVALLERKGHEVIVANNGAEAVGLARSQPFDMVLMDVQMPEMDGLEATKAIREFEWGTGRRLPIVAMTAQAMKEDRERCLAAGMDEYLTKPVRAVQLYETMARVVSLARQRGEPAALVPLVDGRNVSPVVPGAQAAATRPIRATHDEIPQEGGRNLPDGSPRAMVEALKAVDGDADLLRDVARIFLDEAPKLMGEIEEAIARTDPRSLRLAAHTIKGGLRMFGGEAAYELAGRLEEMGRAGNLETAQEPFETLKQTVIDIQHDLCALVAVPVAAASTNSSPLYP